jgi:hypothetical protein
MLSNLKCFILSSLLSLSLLGLLTGCFAKDEKGNPIECTKERPCDIE